MDSKGVTLIELLVAVSIITIVMVVVGFEFFGWQAKFKVESEVKEIESAFMDARMRARQKNIMYFVRFDKTTEAARYDYAVYEDSNGTGTLDIGTDTEVRDLTKKGLPFRLDWDGTAGPTPVGSLLDFAIDEKGFVGLTNNRFFPYPWPRQEGVPDNIYIWLIDQEGRRYIMGGSDYTDRTDIPEIAYDCVRIAETRVNIGKLDINTGVCNEK